MAKKSKTAFIKSNYISLNHQNLMNSKISSGVSIVCFFCPKDITIEQMEEVALKRELRVSNKDWANNSGIPFYDGDMKGIITGCEQTANLIQEITGVKGRYKFYPSLSILK